MITIHPFALVAIALAAAFVGAVVGYILGLREDNDSW